MSEKISIRSKRKLGSLPLDFIITFTNNAKIAKPFDLRKGEIICFIDVPFPLKYKRTKLRKQVYKLQKQWGFIDNKGDELLARAALTYNKTRNDIWLGINVFSNYPFFRKDATKKEQQCCKGLGKELVCLGLNFLVEKEFIKKKDLSKAKFKLKAGGGECLNNKPLPKMSDTKIDDFLKKYPDNYAKVIGTFKTSAKQTKEKRREVCAILENYKLVKYYKTWGLKIVNENDGRAILMEGNLKKVMKKVCNI